jgi:gamma-glutamylaminecyclotransferase
MTYKVFVYGTLLKGEGNHYLMEHDTVEFIGIDKISGFKMINLRYFPACIISKNDSIVIGEVYDFSKYPGLLKVLDNLEGYPLFYNRVEMKTLKGHMVWVYFIDNNRNLSSYKQIKTGDWRRR